VAELNISKYTEKQDRIHFFSKDHKKLTLGSLFIHNNPTF
jgi:hypothetical protein